MPVTSGVVIALAIALAAPLPPVGEPYSIEGRVERIDQGVDATTTWITLPSGKAVAVQEPPGAQPPPPGTRIRVKGTRRDDLLFTDTAGVAQRFPVIHTTCAWTQPYAVATSQAWLGWVLGGIFVLVCGLTILMGRSASPRPRRASNDEPLPPFEPATLPADPVDALAVLARQADEE